MDKKKSTHLVFFKGISIVSSILRLLVSASAESSLRSRNFIQNVKKRDHGRELLTSKEVIDRPPLLLIASWCTASVKIYAPQGRRVLLRQEPRPSPLCTCANYKQAFLPYIYNLVTKCLTP